MEYNIRETHPEYQAFQDAWRIMRDTIGGEDDIKGGGERYLPLKSGMAIIKNDTLRLQAYTAYRDRAEFPELVAPTLRGCAGLICSTAPVIKLPEKMKYLLEDATGEGTTIASLHRTIVTEMLASGRYGLLPGPLADEPGKFGLVGYKTEQIINWERRNNKVIFVVLDESGQEREPATNKWVDREKYLECYIDESGTYTARRWEGAVEGELVNGGNIVATLAGNEPLKILPFVFFETSDLKPEPDDIPMYGLAKIALRIYRIDADYMNALHWTSEPTPYVTGFDDAQGAITRGEVPTTIGASQIWVLPKGATADYLEFSGPGIAAQEKAIQNALERATMFGAQLLSENSKNAESGDSRRLRLQGQHSLMRTVAMTAAAGLERALRNIAIWSGEKPEDVEVRPFLDFMDHGLTANDVAALVAGWQSGAYSKRTLFESMQRGDIIPSERSFEEEEELIKEEGDPLSIFGRDNGQEDGKNSNVKFGAGAGLGVGL